MRNRPGFTAVEMALVATIVGLVSAIALPRLSAYREQSALTGAKRQVITQLAAARASAIQRGTTVVLVADNSTLYLVADVGGTETTISPRARLVPTFDVELEASEEKISFDARGYATSLPTGGATFRLWRGEASDSVCVTRLGTILPECGL